MSQRLRARAILVALAALLVTAAALPPLDRVPVGNTQPPAEGDAALFSAVIARVRTGEGYYPAMGSELRKRGFPTVSIFNWRTPVLYKLMSLAPQASVPVLAVLGLAVLVLTVIHMNSLKATEEVLVAVLAQIGVLCVILAPTITLQTEGWAGLLIVISAFVYTRRSWQMAALIAIVALFVRELAAPYCMVCVILAAKARRGRELLIWATGGAAYAAFYWWHIVQVIAQHAGNHGYVGAWIQFGGIRFLMETTQQSNTVLLLTPYLVSACFLALLGAALWAPAIPVHIRGTVIAYALFFAFVGQSFNDYWGLTVAPAQAVAAGYGPLGLRALLTRAGWRAGGKSAIGL